MTEPTVGEPTPPDWEIIFSHHLATRYSRTFCVRVAGRTLHLCARCSGQVVGILGFVLLFWVCHSVGFPLYVPISQIPFAFGPLPASLDWLTQSLGRRESSNHLRILSGILLGASFSDAVSLFVLRDWLFVAGAAVTLASYLAGVLGSLRIFGGWQKVLEEHFPGYGHDAPR